MKISRKLISMLLSIAMLLSLVPSVTFAAERTVEASGLLYRIQGASSRTLTTDAIPGTSGEVPSGALNPVKWILYSDGELDFELIGDNTVINHSGTALNWGDNKTKIKKVVFPEGVTSIGGTMFNAATSSLTEAVIPASCTYMYNTFAFCSSLSKVTIAKGSKLETLNQTFQQSGITSIDLPASIKEISKDTFQTCSKLTAVTIRGGVVATQAFSQCRNLGPLKLFGNTTLQKQAIVFVSGNMTADNFKVTAGPDVTISDGAVAYSYGVNSSNVVISGVKGSSAETYAKGGFDLMKASDNTVGADGYYPTTKKMNGESVLPITFKAFDGIGDVGELTWIANNTVLTISGDGKLPDQTTAPWSGIADKIRTVIVEEGVTKIGANAFADLPWLKEVQLPSTLTAIGAKAFANDTRLLAAVIPDNVTSIDATAFDSGKVDVCIGKESKLTDKTGCKVYADGKDADTTLSAAGMKWAVYGDNERVLVINGTGAMYNHFGNDTSGATIAPWASYAESIKTVVVGYGITKTTKYLLGKERTSTDTSKQVVYGNIKNVVLGDSVEQIIGNKLWSEELTTINDTVNLEVINLPYNLKQIHSDFLNATNKVKEIFISKNITDTGYRAFRQSSNVESLIFEEGFDGFSTGAGDTDFFGNNSDKLKELTIPSSITTIPKGTFKRMNALEKIEFMGNPTIATGAFRKDLMTNATVYCAKSATNVISWAQNTENSTQLKVVTYIAKGTFENGMNWLVDGDEGNYSLTIDGAGAIPNFTVENPAPWSEWASEIKSVKLDSEVTAIGAKAFDGFDALDSIDIPTAVTLIDDDAFGTMKDGFKIYCTTDYVADYAVSKGFAYAKGSTLSNGIKWVVDGSTLTISGEGAIPGGFYADNTREIPWRDLANFGQIETIIVEEGITSIPAGAFNIASALKTIILPDTLKSLGFSALNESDNLEFIEIPAGIDDGAYGVTYFTGSTELKRVAWLDTGSNLPNINGDTRRNAWTYYVMSDSVAAKQDISGFDRVTRETITANGKIDGTKIEWLVTNEGTLEIYGIGDLASVTTAPWADSAASIKNVYIEEGVTGVGANLFSGINNAYIELPDSVTALGENAFAGCTSKVRVPYSVKNIADSAFVSGATVMSYANTAAKTYAEAKDGVTFDERPGMRLLTIGNSYTEDIAVNHLWRVAQKMGVEEFKIGNLMYPGRNMEAIYNHIKNNGEDYIYREITSGGRAVTKGKAGHSNNIDVGLLADDWDVITLQPWFPDATNGLNGFDDGEEKAEWLNEVVKYVKDKRPNAKLAFNLIWSQNSRLSGVDRTPNVDNNNLKNNNRPNYGNTLYNYNQIVEQVKTHVLNNSNFDYILPTGTAIENARTSFLGGMRGSVNQPYQPIIAGLQRDSTHVNDIGMYIGAMTWVKTLMPNLDIDSLEWAPNVTYNDNNGALSGNLVFDEAVIAEAKWAASKAVETADTKTFAVTTSEKPFRIMAYDNGKVTVAMSNVVRDIGYADMAYTIADDKLTSDKTQNGQYKVDKSKASKIIVAEYDAMGELVGAKFCDFTLTYDEVYGATETGTSYDKSVIDTKFAATNENNNIRVMLWDGFDELKPLANVFGN